MCDDNDNKIIILKPAKELTLSFPKPHKIIEDSGNKTQDLIKQGGYVDSETGRVFMDKKSLPHLLATDQFGANKFYNELDNDDKYENGNKKLVSLPALQKEISERITEPRDTIIRERLKYNEECLITLRDAPENEKDRELLESKNRRDFPKIRKQLIEDNNITHDECTGDTLQQSPHVHHITRRADDPRRTLDPNNLAVVNDDTHEDIHRKNIHDEESLLEYSREHGGNLENRLKKEE